MNKPRLIDEYWEPIKGYKKYRISNYGRVANNETGLLLKPYKQSKWGHAQVSLYHNGKVKKFLVHVLVAKAFVPNSAATFSAAAGKASYTPTSSTLLFSL